MSDTLTPGERSRQMSKVRSTGNRSTEGRVGIAFHEAGIHGWEKQPTGIAGKPDFFFREYSLAVFVDGCFWHACPICKRHIPYSQTEYWSKKN